MKLANSTAGGLKLLLEQTVAAGRQCPKTFLVSKVRQARHHFRGVVPPRRGPVTWREWSPAPRSPSATAYPLPVNKSTTQQPR